MLMHGTKETGSGDRRTFADFDPFFPSFDKAKICRLLTVAMDLCCFSSQYVATEKQICDKKAECPLFLSHLLF